METEYYILRPFIQSVTDLELWAAQAVKAILILILFTGVVINLFRLRKAESLPKKLTRGGIAAFFILASIPVIKWFQIEGNLLSNALYTEGVTVGFCEESAKGAAIEFVYEVDSIEYNNCNTYHPLKLEDITVPGGKYLVRYSKNYPGKGRMDFNKPVNED